MVYFYFFLFVFLYNTPDCAPHLTRSPTSLGRTPLALADQGYTLAYIHNGQVKHRTNKLALIDRVNTEK